MIPNLLHAGLLAAVAAELTRMSLLRYAPFRLIGVEPAGERVLEARWDRERLETTWHTTLPICFVSSGLGDALVLPRLDLFEQSVAGPGATKHRQDQFHRHTWPDRPELSVMMNRADARTVSVTTLEVQPAVTCLSIQMAYEPVPEPTRAATPVPALVRAGPV